MSEYNLVQFARISGLTLAARPLLLVAGAIRFARHLRLEKTLALRAARARLPGVSLFRVSFVFVAFHPGACASSISKVYSAPAYCTKHSGAGLAGGVIVQYANELPFVVQRSISFLPVDINPIVRRDVEHSSDWRFDMWRTLLPEVPQYC